VLEPENQQPHRPDVTSSDAEKAIFPSPVAVAITLFGANSGAALATVVGVLTVCSAFNRTRHWFAPPAAS
jgi:hypothetical protein